MLKKELQDTLRASLLVLVISAGILLFAYFVTYLYAAGLGFKDFFVPAGFTFLLLIAFGYGSSLFVQAQNGETFE